MVSGIRYAHTNLIAGSVQGFRRTRGGLVTIAGSHRALGLDASAAPEFVNTPEQVAFSPDGS